MFGRKKEPEAEPAVTRAEAHFKIEEMVHEYLSGESTMTSMTHHYTGFQARVEQAVDVVVSKHIRKIVDEFLQSEQILDDIVERLRKKQLK